MELEDYLHSNNLTKIMIVEDTLDYYENLLIKKGEFKVYYYEQFGNTFKNIFQIVETENKTLTVKFTVETMKDGKSYSEFIPLSNRLTYTTISPTLLHQNEFSYLITSYKLNDIFWFKYSIISPHYLR